MRVSGGKVKGTRLKTLPKRTVRPTTSVVRQAIFSLLENRTTNWHRVLDLYAYHALMRYPGQYGLE